MGLSAFPAPVCGQQLQLQLQLQLQFGSQQQQWQKSKWSHSSSSTCSSFQWTRIWSASNCLAQLARLGQL